MGIHCIKEYCFFSSEDIYLRAGDGVVSVVRAVKSKCAVKLFQIMNYYLQYCIVNILVKLKMYMNCLLRRSV